MTKTCGCEKCNCKKCEVKCSCGECKKRKERYNEAVFGKKELSACDKKRGKEALNWAHEIRKFEIELYWKRSIYFWGFILVLVGGYFLMLSMDNPPSEQGLVLFGIALLGLFTSLSWRFMEIGAGAWQGNFEFHIDFLEDEFTGRFHKTIIGNRDEFFSVSKINKSIITAICFFWSLACFLGIYKTYPCSFCWLDINASDGLVLSFFVIFLVFILIYFLACGEKPQKSKPPKYCFFGFSDIRGIWRTSPKTFEEPFGNECPCKNIENKNIDIFQRGYPKIPEQETSG